MNGEDLWSYITKPLMNILHRGLPHVSIVLDRGPTDLPTRKFEVFEVFFVMPAGIDQLEPGNTDSYTLIRSIVTNSAHEVEERFVEIAGESDDVVVAIGIAENQELLYGPDVLEGEAMLGDLDDPLDSYGLFRFKARFIVGEPYVETRCKTRRVQLPELPPYAEEMPEHMMDAGFEVGSDGIVRRRGSEELKPWRPELIDSTEEDEDEDSERWML